MCQCEFLNALHCDFWSFQVSSLIWERKEFESNSNQFRFKWIFNTHHHKLHIPQFGDVNCAKIIISWVHTSCT
jgi:hypothetical protein